MSLVKKFMSLGNAGKIFLGAVSLLTITGTFGGVRSCQPLRIYKNGNSFGINANIGTVYEEGARHYGLNIGIGNVFHGGNVNGVNLGLVNVNCSDSDLTSINGVELSLVSLPERYASSFNKGCELPVRVNGFQFGGVIYGRGNLVQLGAYCHTQSGDGKSQRTLPFVNWRFD